jgi:hypothetical protein
MLHRVLPWLWRLADEDAGHPTVPWELQQQLLEALQSCPAAEDAQVCVVVVLRAQAVGVWRRPRPLHSLAHARVSVACRAQVHDKVAMLVDTLKAVWLCPAAS